MKWSKLLECFPGRKKKRNQHGVDGESVSEFGSIDENVFDDKQKAKAVAVVLSGYDPEVAAQSIEPPCTIDMVERWVNLYRPPFFEDGMRCPPALISWWMKELERKEAEFAQAVSEQPSITQTATTADSASTFVSSVNSVASEDELPSKEQQPYYTATIASTISAVGHDSVKIEELNANTSATSANGQSPSEKKPECFLSLTSVLDGAAKFKGTPLNEDPGSPSPD